MVAPARFAAVTTRSSKVVHSSWHFALLRDRRAGFLEHRQPLLDGEHRRLAGMHADREHEPVGEACGLADDVEVAVGDRIERPGIERGARHGGGSSVPN